MKNVFTALIALFALTSTAFAGQTITIPDPKGTIFRGERGGDYAGETTISIGNFTGDVFPETLINVRNFATSVHAGRVYIKRGSINGLPQDMNLATQSDITIEGENYGWTGTNIRVVPDLNGDGYTEILVSSGSNLYLIYGAQNFPPSFKITDVGTTIAGKRFITNGQFQDAEFGDFDKDGNVDMLIAGSGLLAGEAGIIYLSKLPAGAVTINAALFDGIKGKKIPNVVGFMQHSVAVLDLDNNGQTDYVFIKDTQIRVYINDVLKSTINTAGIANAAMVFNAGDMNNDGLADFVIHGNIYPSGPATTLIFNRVNWPASMTLAIDGTSASRLSGIGQFNTSLGHIIAPFPQGLLIGDDSYSSGAGRVIVLDKKNVWPATYTITASEQSDNTKIVGGVRIGKSVSYSENLYGGIGCQANVAILVGANALNQISNSYVVQFKK
jgi:hypothetical protein